MRSLERQTSTRAVQYLRMSTEHQRYSLENQAAAISTYAAEKGLQVVASYEDAGKSGLTLKNRPGLQRLLADCISPERDFSAILVLDVSRWGRFQDTDEAAHYEFICRQSGVRVIYCAEAFEDDGRPMSSVLKHLKRVMAAEYSRELSAKLVRARLQQARLGFRQGGVLVYGFRRLLVSADGEPRQVLESGALKAVHSDRVRIIPGPESELEVIRRIFRLYVAPGGSFAGIARQLNDDGVPAGTGRPWHEIRIRNLIRNELVIGQYTFNKVARRLREPPIRNPETVWVRVAVCDPIVEPAVFRKAQRLAADGGRRHFSDEQMLVRLKRLLDRKGHLSPAVIDAARGLPSWRTYEHRFGSMRQAYALVGYSPSSRKWIEKLGGYWTEEAVLDAVRTLYAKHGFVTNSLLKPANGAPSSSIVQRRFGSLRRCYELAGLPHEMVDLYRAAQLRRHPDKSPAEADMLEALRKVLDRCGRLTQSIIDDAPETLSADAYRRTFGSLPAAYRLIGCPSPRYFNARDDGRRTSDAYLLDGLRRLLATHGYVDGPMVDADPHLPSQSVYRERFGGMMQAYRLIGWNMSRPELSSRARARRTARAFSAS